VVAGASLVIQSVIIVKTQNIRNLLIFCDNYTQVFQTLHRLSSGNYDTGIVVVTQYENLFKFFEAENEKAFGNRLKVIFPVPYVSKVVKSSWLKKVWLMAADIMQHKRYLNEIYEKYFAGLENFDVVFGPGYNDLQCVYLKKLARRNRVIYFSPQFMAQLVAYVPRNVKDWLVIIFLKLTYGWSVGGVAQAAQVAYLKGGVYLSERIIAKHATIVKPEQQAEMMKEFNADRFKVFNAGSYKVMYFHDDFVEAPYSGVDEAVVNRELAEVFRVLSKHFTLGEIATKFTPGSAPKQRPQVGDILPAFIPAELLYNDNVKIYLSIASGAIFNVERGTAVSMADMITFNDEKVREQLKQVLIQRSKSKILFPKTLDEFEKIVIGLKQ
jgi:hypothetical protein